MEERKNLKQEMNAKMQIAIETLYKRGEISNSELEMLSYVKQDIIRGFNSNYEKSIADANRFLNNIDKYLKEIEKFERLENKETELQNVELDQSKLNLFNNKDLLDLIIDYGPYNYEISSVIEENLSKYCNNDKETVLKCINKIDNNGDYHSIIDIEYEKYVLDNLKNNKEFVNDKEFIIEAMKKSVLFLEYASDELKNDKEFMIKAVKEFGCDLEYASDELKNDKEFMIKVIEECGLFIEDASEALRNDPEIAIAALSADKNSIKYVGYDLWANKEFVLEAVKIDKSCLENASEELAMDKEVVLTAINHDGMALEWADDELKNDKEIVLAAVKQNKEAIKYASLELQNDKEFMEMIENIQKEQEEKTTHNITEVEESISDRKVEDINKVSSELKEAMRENEQEVNKDEQYLEQ